MRILLPLVPLMLATNPVNAADAAQLMSGLIWEKRVLLIFAPTADHAQQIRQRELLDAVEPGLRERDMTVIEAFADSRLLDRKAGAQEAASYYRHFDVDSSEFRVILVGKDGTVKLERGRAVDSSDLFTLIDSMPMRRHEMLQDE